MHERSCAAELLRDGTAGGFHGGVGVVTFFVYL